MCCVTDRSTKINRSQPAIRFTQTIEWFSVSGMADTETASTRADGGVRSIARAVEVLELFDVEHPTRTLRELVASTGLPKTTVVRLLSTLDSLGLIADRGDSTFGVGAGFLRWVTLAQSMWEVSTETRQNHDAAGRFLRRNGQHLHPSGSEPRVHRAGRRNDHRAQRRGSRRAVRARHGRGRQDPAHRRPRPGGAQPRRRTAGPAARAAAAGKSPVSGRRGTRSPTANANLGRPRSRPRSSPRTAG